MDILLLEKLAQKDKQIIVCISRGQAQDLVLDVYSKNGLTLTKTDEMMLKNITALDLLDRDDYVLN